MQWLDELEDLFFAVALGWERLRQRLLQVGLIAALALACSPPVPGRFELSPIFAAVALSSVIAWFGGTVLAHGSVRDGGLKNIDPSLS